MGDWAVQAKHFRSAILSLTDEKHKEEASHQATKQELQLTNAELQKEKKLNAELHERFAKLSGASETSTGRIYELEKSTSELREALKGSQDFSRSLQSKQSEERASMSRRFDKLVFQLGQMQQQQENRMDIDAEGNPGEVASPDKGKSPQKGEGNALESESSKNEKESCSQSMLCEDAKPSDAEDNNGSEERADALVEKDLKSEFSELSQKLDETERECQRLRDDRTRAASTAYHLVQATGMIVAEIKVADANVADKWFLQEANGTWAEVLRIADEVTAMLEEFGMFEDVQDPEEAEDSEIVAEESEPVSQA